MQTDETTERITTATKPTHITYELNISDFIDVLVPPINCAIEQFDPHKYYVTSGDAVQKCLQLHKDLYSYACRVRTLCNKHKTDKLTEFQAKCWGAVGGAYSMLKTLQRLRTTAVFFETEWSCGKLYVTRKNPRAKK